MTIQIQSYLSGNNCLNFEKIPILVFNSEADFVGLVLNHRNILKCLTFVLIW